MTIHHPSYLFFLTCNLFFDQSAWCTSKKVITVVIISQIEKSELYITLAILSLVKGFPGSFLICWYILQITWLRFPYSLLCYYYILYYASTYLSGLPNYMVSASGKTSNIVLSFQISNAILEVHTSYHTSDLTRVRFDTWQWIWMGYNTILNH